MKKVFGIAAIFFAVACSSPESKVESTSDSAGKFNENTVTNSPPGGSTDTSGMARGDTSSTDTMHHQ